ncbi:MAG: DUF2189 domain-containing protein [Acetobacteraceae bacterium]|nr:DUF2189 domain-containing protein [Acetobacteraceae bacterium]
MSVYIRSPVEWGWDQLRALTRRKQRKEIAAGRAAAFAPPEVRRITFADVWQALREGIEDFADHRTDVIFLCLIYPIAGLLLARLALGQGAWQLLFPLGAGFALIGPFAGVGLMEMSRLRERGEDSGWQDAFAVLKAPNLGAIVVYGLMLAVIFLLWLAAAAEIYQLTLGPGRPASLSAFLHDVFRTSAGWTMIGVGMGVGFIFALIVLVCSVVAFPLLLDRNADVGTALFTSLRASFRNPLPVGLWGLIVAVGLLLGSIPFFVGLAVVMPVLGHASWHLYRKLVVPLPSGQVSPAGKPVPEEQTV